MTDHDALLRAIVENPAEDTPRLVFADWLDEHADAFPTPALVRLRAAFIRDDIAMSQRDEYDPVRLRWELIEKPKREAEAWVSATLPPAPWGNFLCDPLLHRGFPWAMEMNHSQRARFGHDWTVEFPLERVRFVQGAEHGLDALSRVGLSNRLSTVELDGSGYKAPTWFSRLSAFERVERFGARRAIGAYELNRMTSSPLFARLTGLTVTEAGIGPEVLLEVARAGAGSALRALTLTGCGVTSGAVAALMESPAADCLESLSLGGDRINAPGKFRAFGRVSRPMALRSLEMNNEVPNEDALEAFLSSTVVFGLRSLCLRGCTLNRSRAQLLASGTFENLCALDIASNAIGNDGAAALVRSPHFAGLRVLNLSHCMVGDEGVLAILESPLADGLVYLDLLGSPASAETKELLKKRMGDRVRV